MVNTAVHISGEINFFPSEARCYFSPRGPASGGPSRQAACGGQSAKRAVGPPTVKSAALRRFTAGKGTKRALKGVPP